MLLALTAGGYFFFLIKKNAFPGRPGLPREIPPKHYSPAVLRYVYVQDVDGDSLISAVLNAVVKNNYRIRWHNQAFSVEHNPVAPSTRLTPDERAALTFNGRHYIKQMKVGRTRNRLTHKAEVRLRNAISKQHKRWLFPFRQYLLVSFALSLILLGLAAAFIGPVPHLFMLPYFMLGWPVIGLCAYGVYYAWEHRNFAALPIAAVFGLVGLMLLFQVEKASPSLLFPYLIPLVAVHYWAWKRIPRLRPEGSRLHSEVEEFRSFLIQKVETSPKLSPTEYYLIPYLVALEIPFERDQFFSKLLTKDPGIGRLPGSPV
jgi:hypothetical protein